MVSASMRPGPCTMQVNANFSEVCLPIQGDDSAGQCVSKAGANPAVLYYPYRPGATYIVKGQGCADIMAPPFRMCQNVGPTAMTV